MICVEQSLFVHETVRPLTLVELVLRAGLAKIDSFTVMPDAPLELSMTDLDRDAYVAGVLATRRAYASSLQAERRSAWRKRYGGPAGKLAAYLRMSASATKAVDEVREREGSVLAQVPPSGEDKVTSIRAARGGRGAT
jgi:hypothetical protein